MYCSHSSSSEDAPKRGSKREEDKPMAHIKQCSQSLYINGSVRADPGAGGGSAEILPQWPIL